MADKRYVFLSYGRKDVYEGATNAVEQEQHFPIVEKVYHYIKQVRPNGLEPWFDKLSLTHDRPFTDSIQQAIEQSEYMLLFIGANSICSEWCEREWKHALRNCVPVIPILLQGKWGYKILHKTYPSSILSVDGIDPRRKDKSIDDNSLLNKIISAIQQKPAPLTIPHNASRLPDHYIERPQYLDDLKKRLGVNDRNYKGQTNIVGITSKQEIAGMQGIGGIGKTTLALALCNDCEVKRAFDNIVWVDVGPDTQPENAVRLMKVIGTALKDNPTDYDNMDAAAARARLQNLLANKRSLLVLDDVWAEGLVGQFSLSGVDCRLVVTTRNKGLVDDPQAIAKMSADEGLRLLATLFNPVAPDVSVLNVQHRTIVTTLDGYTLAIEIAGKWLKKYGQGRAAEYVKRLNSDESGLLKTLTMSKSDKNANLELSLSLSYNDLDAEDQGRFRALGMFTTGSSFPLAALDALWGTENGFEEAQRLVNAGLLETLTPQPPPHSRQSEGEQSVVKERYVQHSLLRAYARALTKSEEEDDLFTRYADFYTKVADQFSELPPEEWGVLEDDLPNIHAVGDELVKQTNKGQSGNLERALTFASNATQYLFRLRQVRRIEWSEMGLNAARQLQATVEDKELYLRRETRFLNDLGLVWSDLGEKRKALDYYDQALLIYREMGDQRGEATTLNNIGSAWSDLGEKRKALDYYDQALLLYRAVGGKGGEATTLSNIGTVWNALGEKRKALVYYDQALPLKRAVGDKGSEATILGNIGMVWNALGEKDKALEYLDQALLLYRAVGDKGGEATTLNNIGFVWSDLGEKRRALDYCDQALLIYREMGDQRGEATTLNDIAQIYYQNGDKQQALDYVDKAINISRDIGDISQEAALHVGKAVILKDFGHIDISLVELRETISILKRYDLPYDASGGSVQEYKATLQQWERERDGLPLVEDEQAQAMAAILKIYQEQGEEGLRERLKRASMDDTTIEQVIAAIKGMDKLQ